VSFTFADLKYMVTVFDTLGVPDDTPIVAHDHFGAPEDTLDDMMFVPAKGRVPAHIHLVGVPSNYPEPE
jgi:hypothetical protein